MKEKSNASALLWEQAQPPLGADSFAAGSRCGRIWEQMRSSVVPRSTISRNDGLEWCGNVCSILGMCSLSILKNCGKWFRPYFKLGA